MKLPTKVPPVQLAHAVQRSVIIFCGSTRRWRPRPQ